jgi:hypothetical protein
MLEEKPSPLALASTDELIDELKGRYDACLIAVLRSDKKTNSVLIDYKCLTACIGLAERARARLVEIALSPSEDMGEGAED